MTPNDLQYVQAQIEVAVDSVDARLIDVAPVSPAVKSTVVSDGLNYFVALSNLSQLGTPPITGTLTLTRPIQAMSMGIPVVTGYTMQEVESSVTNPGSFGPLSALSSSYTLQAKETKLIYIGAQIQDVTAVVGTMETKIASIETALGQSPWDQYEGDTTNAARALLEYIRTILALGSHPERAVAGFAILSNFLFLRAARRGSDIAVDASRMDFSSPGTAIPVSNAETQVVHLFHGHEEQNSEDTGARGIPGRAVIPVAKTEDWHFDFVARPMGGSGFSPQYVQNLTGKGPKDVKVEVHVHDPALGTETFVVV